MTTETETPETEIEAPKPVIADDDSAFDDDDMSLLSDEERAALVDDAQDDEAEPEGDSDEDADDEDSAPADPAPAADAAPEHDAVEPEQPPARAQAEPLPDTAPLDARLKAIEAERDALVEQFEDGDLTRDDYRKKLAAFAAEERQLAAQVAKVEARQEAIAEQFYGEVRNYAKEYPELLDPNGPHVEAYDRHVRAVTASSEYEHLSYREMLQAAHALYEAEARVLKRAFVPIAAEPAPKPADPKPAAPVDKPKAKRPEIPPSIAKAPAAAAVAVTDNRFAALQQRIDAARDASEIEAIMSSLSPAEAEAFASMDA